MSSTANRVIKNTGFLYAKMGITMFISLYTTRLILNSLGASDFGIFNIVGGAISMLGFLNAAMASATQRFMSYSEGEGNKEKQKTIFNVSFVLHFVISFIVGLALLIAGYFFFNGILNIPEDRIFAAQVVYGSLIVSTMFTVMTVPYDAAMNAHENMKYYAIVGVLESLLKLSVAFACVYTSHDKLIVYGALMACIPLVTLSIMRIYCHRNYEECIVFPKRYCKKNVMKEMTSFAGWNFLNALSGIISQYGLSIVLNHFWGTLLNAAQGIANQISGQLMVFSNTMLKALNPVIIKNKGSNNDSLVIKAAYAGCKYSYIMLIIFALPFILETSYILKIWLDYIPDWAIVFCRLQLVRSIIEQLTISIAPIIYAQGQIKGFSSIKSIIGIQPIIFTALFFYFHFPPYTMYLIWIFSGGILGGFVSLYYSKKLYNLKYKEYFQNVIMPTLIPTLFAFVIGCIPAIIIEPSLCRLIITIIITTVSLLLSFWLFTKEEEREIIKSVIKKLCRKIV